MSWLPFLCDVAQVTGGAAGGTPGKQQTLCVCVCVCVVLALYFLAQPGSTFCLRIAWAFAAVMIRSAIEHVQTLLLWSFLQQMLEFFGLFGCSYRSLSLFLFALRTQVKLPSNTAFFPTYFKPEHFFVGDFLLKPKKWSYLILSLVLVLYYFGTNETNHCCLNTVFL
jgi:hypothetical protein